MEWVCDYYFTGAGASKGAPWRWAYAHHAAPLLRHLAENAQAARRLLRGGSAEKAAISDLKPSSLVDRAGPAPMSAAERRRHRAQRKARARGQVSAAAAETDEDAAALLVEWCALPDGPVPVQLQLLAVIPPESAAASYPTECMRVMQEAKSSGGKLSSSFARLADMFPTAEQTCACIMRGRRFAWQAVVRVEPVVFAFVAAALDDVLAEADERVFSRRSGYCAYGKSLEASIGSSRVGGTARQCWG
jgi:hypothetical protein